VRNLASLRPDTTDAAVSEETQGCRIRRYGMREKEEEEERNRTATALLIVVTRVTRRLLFDCTAPPVWVACHPFVRVSTCEGVRAMYLTS